MCVELHVFCSKVRRGAFGHFFDAFLLVNEQTNDFDSSENASKIVIIIVTLATS